MARLNQIIAVSNGQKSRTQKAVTATYQKLQKEALLTGLSRQYRPKDEDGEQLPPESKRVNYRVSDALRDVKAALVQLFDVVATQDKANCSANADVVVDGQTVLIGIPATTLIFLEKQVGDIHTLIEKLPVLDSADEWTYSKEQGCYVTPAVETVRTKKIPKSFVKYEATPEHPAQVDMYSEDVTVGYWKTVKFSGAIGADEKAAMLERVCKFQDALKIAREEANNMEVEQQKIGDAVFKHLFP